MARTLPVDGWMATIEEFLCWATARRAAVSARALIVVAALGRLPGGMTAAWLPATVAPAVVWSSTDRPGRPWPFGGACLRSTLAMVVSPASPYEARLFP